MRILIYLDAPLHTGQAKFAKSMARRLVRMLADSLSKGNEEVLDTVRILIGQKYRFLSRDFPALEGRLFCPSRKEIGTHVGAEDRAPESSDATDTYNASQAYHPEPRESSLAWALGSFNCDVIVCLYENSAVRQFAQSVGIPCIFLRKGYCSTYLYDAVIFDVDEAVLPALPSDPVDLQPFSTLQRMLPKDLFDRALMPLDSRHARTIYRSIGNNVLIPLNRQDDSNTRPSLHDRNTKDLLMAILPRLTAAGYVCYVLPYPCSKRCSINRRDHRLAKRLCQSLKNVVWLTDIRTPGQCTSLINKMDVVIAQDSPLGFDAMLMGLPVILLGKTVWPGFENAASILDLENGRLCPEQLKACRQQSLRMANFLLRWALVPTGLAFDGTYFVHRIERLWARAKGGVWEGGPSSQVYNSETILSEYDVLRRYHLNSTCYKPTEQLLMHSQRAYHNYYNKLDRVQRKGRKFLRDPYKFLLDSQHLSLRSMGQILARNR